MKWQIYVTLMAEMVIFTLKSVAALHESTFLCNAAIVARPACPSCLPVMLARPARSSCLFVMSVRHARPCSLSLTLLVMPDPIGHPDPRSSRG